MDAGEDDLGSSPAVVEPAPSAAALTRNVARVAFDWSALAGVPAVDADRSAAAPRVITSVGAHQPEEVALPVRRFFTDGACPNNGRGAAARAGVGVYSPGVVPLELAFPLHPDEPQTNQRAELTAFIAALAALERADSARGPHVAGAPVVADITTDSLHCVNGATSFLRLWTAKPPPHVQNRDLWITLFSLLRARQERLDRFRAAHGVRIPAQPLPPAVQVDANAQHVETTSAVIVRWVKGHDAKNKSAAAVGNKAADQLAVAGALRAGLVSQTIDLDAASALDTAPFLTAAKFAVSGLALKRCDPFRRS